MAESLVFQTGSAAPPSLNIPSESQTFTSNGTFTAPHDGSYIVILNAPIAKTGSGGRGGGAATAQYNWGAVGGGGGAGGSAYKATSPGIISVSLNKDDQVQITVNTSISSFGNYASFSRGTAPGNGSAGGNGSLGSSNEKKHGKGGAGGAGGGKPVFSASQESTIIFSPNLPDANLTGGTGTTASGEYYDGTEGAKGGVASSSTYGIPGQTGGWGQATQDYSSFSVGVEPIAPIIDAQIGNVIVIWGNS